MLCTSITIIDLNYTPAIESGSLNAVCLPYESGKYLSLKKKFIYSKFQYLSITKMY